MKKFLFAIIPILAFALFTSEQMSDNGRAAKTGSPGEDYCSDCHNDFTLNSGGGSAVLQITGMPGFQYTPGQTYTMSVTVSRSSNSLFGIGIEALNSANQNAGTLIITDAASTQIKSANVSGVSRRNVVHTLNGGVSVGSKVFNFSWTAPVAGTGNVTFYFCGVAANGDGDNDGDYVYSGSQALTELTCFAPAQPTAISGSDTVCNSSVNTYSVAAVSGATSYTWTLPSGWTGTSTTNSIDVTANTTSGNISVTAENTCGVSPSQTMTVNIATISVSAITDNVSCNGSANGSAIATANGTAGPFTYEWNPSGGFDATASNLSPGNYTVTSTDVAGCTATTSISITEPPSIILDAGLDRTICGSGSLTLGGTPTALGGVGGFTYLWTPSTGLNDSSSANPTCSVASTTAYALSVTDANGCFAGVNTVITVSPAVNATISFDGVNLFASTGVTYQWYYNTGLIPGATSSNYTPTLDGTYYVIVTEASGCSGTSPDYVYIGTGIFHDYKNVFTVYPNPASENFVISLEEKTNNAIMTVTDVTGRIVMAQLLNNQINTIDISALSIGVYLVKIQNGEKLSSTRVFVSR